MELLPVDGDFFGAIDSEADFVATDFDNYNRDVVVNHD